MRRTSWVHFSILSLALGSAGHLAACSDDASSTGSTGTPGSGGSGGGGGGGGGGGEGAGDITPSEFWKHQVDFPNDPFLSAWTGAVDPIRWIKFTVLKRDLTKVYFQDSMAYPFHGPFAVERLDPFMGMSLAEYDQVSLYEANQEAILGAVLYSPRPESLPEYGIQLVRKDAYDPEVARTILELVKANIVAPAGVRSFYFPTYDQEESAKQNSAFFEGSGFPVSSVDRWLSGNQCYSTGWAIGRLRYFPPDQIESAYATGALKPEDILLTDSVPAELPYLAGIVSLSASTPNAHTAILATSFGIPFTYLADPAAAQRAQDLVDKDIALRAKAAWVGCVVDLVDVDGALDPADRAQLLDLKVPPDLNVPPKQPFGALTDNTDNLGPADVVHFGGKASNYGLLRDAIPGSSQEAIAFSFDLWDAFLDQSMDSNQTLREEIAARLDAYTYPPDLLALKADLAAIRNRILNDTTFTASQQQGIQAALQVFGATTGIRFRSSTNVEDGTLFTGAGLYDSATGCLADDTDVDDVGPSHCDSSKDEERGVYRAIRKVYASFYNDNAVFARLLHGVDEWTAGMAMLAHAHYPDSEEMANGVATNTRTDGPQEEMRLVTQLGAVSVTNPEGNALPEVVRASRYGSEDAWLEDLAGSSLVPLGDHVMAWKADYEELSNLLSLVANRFATVHNKTSFLLDYEYKKMQPGKLFVKQVREVAQPDTTPSLTPFLLPERALYCTYQGEYGDVFANHRLKLRIELAAKSTWLTPATLAQPLFADSSASYLFDDTVKTLSGAPTSWPGAAHEVNGGETRDVFTDGAGATARTYALVTSAIPSLMPRAEGPLVTLRDLGLSLTADYATPVPILDWDGTPITTSTETVFLGTCPEDNAGEAIPRTVTYTTSSGVKVTISFFWPRPPTGPTAGYTAPLHRWDETRIEGLIPTPIVLKGYYSQTYRPQHHNFSEDFLFEPALEEGIDPAIIAALEANNIRRLFVAGEPSNFLMYTMDPAGGFHPVD